MRPIHAGLFVSLDGFATDASGEMRWAMKNQGEDLHRHVRKQLAEAGHMLLGRVTYEEFASYWPHATNDMAELMNGVPKAVVSKTLDEGTWGDTRLLGSDLAEEVTNLKQESGGPINVTGSLSLVQGLIRHGLLDRLDLLVYPVVLGSAGARRAFEGYDETDLKLVNTTVQDDKGVLLQYEPTTLRR